MWAPQPDATVPRHDKEKVALEGQGNGSDDAESIDSFTNPTGINEKALLRRLDWKLLPPLTLLYLLSFLDRSNSMYSARLSYGRRKDGLQAVAPGGPAERQSFVSGTWIGGEL
jgi:hypothetical protein